MRNIVGDLPPKKNVLSTPSFTVVIGDAGAGKTRWALDWAEKGGGNSLIVTPSQRGADRLNRALASSGGSSGGTYALTFSMLISELVRAPDGTPTQNLGFEVQRLVIAALIKEHVTKDDYFGKMLNSPGFAAAFQRSLREWKSLGVTSTDLEVLTRDSQIRLPGSTFQFKMLSFIRVFKAYEQFLTENRLHDFEDSLHLATDRTRLHGPPHVYRNQRVVFDGFYQFDRAQINLICALASAPRESRQATNSCKVAVTLTLHQTRPLLFATTERTLQQLNSAYGPGIHIQEVVRPHNQSSEHAVIRLGARLYRMKSPYTPDSPEPEDVTPDCAALNLPSSLPADQCIQMLSAPNAYMEAEMVAREFVRLQSIQGYSWRDLGIVVRNSDDYWQTLTTVFERFGIPLTVGKHKQLLHNPVIICLLNLLAVYRHGWARQHVIAFLKSSYVTMNRIGADSVSVLAHRLAIGNGKQHWLGNSTQLCADYPDAHRILMLMGEQDTLLCEEGLTMGQRSQRLLDLIQTFRLLSPVGNEDTIRFMADSAALRSAAESLTHLTTLAKLRSVGPVSFEHFVDQVVASWAQAHYHEPGEPNSVHLVEPHATRDYAFRACAVMGLTESMFPRRMFEDPFLRNDERAALSAIANIRLEPHQNFGDYERLLFYIAITAPSERLMLSYPRSGPESDVLPSFFLDEVEAACFGTISIARRHTTLADIVPNMADALPGAETTLAAAADLFHFGPVLQNMETVSGGVRITAAQVLRQAIHHSAADPGVVGAISSALASRLLPSLPALYAEDIRDAFYTFEHVLPVQDLKVYSRCPFQYMLTKRMAVAQDPCARYLALKTQIVRDTVRRYFAMHGQRDLASFAEVFGEFARLASEACTSEMSETCGSVVRQFLLKASVLDALRGVAIRECTYQQRFGMRPARFDLSFGTDAKSAVDDSAQGLHEISGVTASGLNGAPLALRAAGEAAEVKLSGVIDRVDIDSEGKALILSFSADVAPDYGSLVRGEALDVPIYMMAAERLFHLVAAVGCVDSFLEPGRARLIRTQHVSLGRFAPLPHIEEHTTVRTQTREQYAELVRTTTMAATRIAKQMIASDITPTPGSHCLACNYSSICRTTIAAGHDGGVSRERQS